MLWKVGENFWDSWDIAEGKKIFMNHPKSKTLRFEYQDKLIIIITAELSCFLCGPFFKRNDWRVCLSFSLFQEKQYQFTENIGLTFIHFPWNLKSTIAVFSKDQKLTFQISLLHSLRNISIWEVFLYLFEKCRS